MSVGTTTALVLGGLSAAGAIGGAAISAHGAKSAAETQANAATDATHFLQDTEQPYLDLGKYSAGSLMKGLQDGTFGPGSIPDFKAPSLQDARNSPGYQFTLNQGMDTVQRSAAARGSLGSGGTLKALQSFGTGLADNTYNDVYARSMETYRANLAKQGQEYGQILGPTTLGASAAGDFGHSVADLMTGSANARAAAQVGSANAWSSGISGASNGVLQALLLHGMGQTGATPPFIPSGAI